MKKTLLLLMILLANGFTLFHLKDIKINNVALTYLNQERDEIKYTLKVKKDFGSDDYAILVFDHKRTSLDTFLKKLDKVSQSLQEIEGVEKVYSITQIEHFDTHEDGFDVTTLVQEKTLENFSREKLMARLRESQVAHKSLYNHDLTQFAIIIEPLDYDDSFSRLKLSQRIDGVIQSHKFSEHLIHKTGYFYIDLTQFKALMDGLSKTVPLTTVIAAVLISLVVANLKVIILGLFFNATASLLSMGVYAYIDYPYNLVGLTIPTFISAIFIASFIHLLFSFKEGLALGYKNKALLRYMKKDVAKPIAFTMITTFVAIFSLTTNQTPPMVSFGLVCSFGLVIISLLILFVPFFLVKIPYSPHKNMLYRLRSPLAILVMRVSVRYRALIFVLLILIGLLSLHSVGKIKTETNALKFYPDTDPIVLSTLAYEREFSGTYPLSIVLKHQQGLEVVNSQILSGIQKLTQELLKDPTVDRVNSPVTFIKDMHWAFNNKKEQYRVIPKNDNLIQQYLLLYGGQDLEKLMTRDARTIKVDFFLNKRSTTKTLELIKKIKSKAKEVLPQEIDLRVAGGAYLYYFQDNDVRQSQAKSALWSLSLIFILMLILWKSLFQAIIIMIPNLFPIYFIFVYMGESGISLNMATAMIASIALGVAIDDSIHVFYRISTSLKQGKSILWSLKETYQKCSMALISTTIILVSQFFSMTVADFIPTRNFGLLTGLALLVALLFDLFVLPALVYSLYQIPFTRRFFKGKKV